MKCASCKHYTGDASYEWWCFLSRSRSETTPREKVAMRPEGNPCAHWSPMGFSDPILAKEAAKELIERIDAFLLREAKEDEG